MTTVSPDAKRMRAYRQTPEGRAYVTATNRARAALAKRYPKLFKELFQEEYQRALNERRFADEK